MCWLSRTLSARKQGVLFFINGFLLSILGIFIIISIMLKLLQAGKKLLQFENVFFKNVNR